MGKSVTVSAKIPEEVYKELALRVSGGERSAFVRNAIIEKMRKTPRPDRILNLESRVEQLENSFSEIRQYLARLEVLTYRRGQINPHAFGIDDIDHRIIDYLLHYKGATTPELAEHMKTNRWLILNRLRKIQSSSKKQLGKPLIQYSAGVKSGKRKAWWLNEELVET
jgi:hypothetical protein